MSGKLLSGSAWEGGGYRRAAPGAVFACVDMQRSNVRGTLMSGFLDAIAASYNEVLERHRKRPFLRAAMAACALVATADGVVTLRDRVRVDQVLAALQALRVFDPHEGVNVFNEFVAVLQDDPARGRAVAISAIRTEADKDRDRAEILIRICIAVSRVAGGIPRPQRAEIMNLCTLLGLDAGAANAQLDREPGERAVPSS
jgi:tellurite resistance protein